MNSVIERGWGWGQRSRAWAVKGLMKPPKNLVQLHFPALPLDSPVRADELEMINP